jgi:hypothetical protein
MFHVASRAAVPKEKSARVADGISFCMESSAPLRSFASSALKLFFCFSAVKAVHSCSTPFPDAKRCIRADPFNPPNPRPKMLMPARRETVSIAPDLWVHSAFRNTPKVGRKPTE